MQKEFGLTPPTNTLGCLQDPHWASGAFGYFPTYTIGSMLAAQLWEAAGDAILKLGERVSVGGFAELKDWLLKTIHCHGCRFSTEHLIVRATGEEPNPLAYIRYLTTKYGKLYGIAQ